METVEDYAGRFGLDLSDWLDDRPVPVVLRGTLGVLAAKFNYFYLGEAVPYYNDSYSLIFKKVANYQPDFMQDASLYVEAQFLVSSLHPLGPPALAPRTFIGEKSLLRFYKFLDYNKRMYKNCFMSPYRMWYLLDKKVPENQRLYDDCLYTWVSNWLLLGSKELATSLVLASNPLAAKTYRPKFSKRIAKRVSSDLAFSYDPAWTSWDEFYNSYVRGNSE